MTTIYDNDDFFNAYVKLRESPNNYNALIERPLMLELIDNVDGQSILDIGCGFGDIDKILALKGALRILAIDSSHKMIEKALCENSDANVEYSVMDAKNISQIEETFDLVISSLAFHYIDDFEKLICQINELLKHKGKLCFSIEHPIYTACLYFMQWEYDDDGFEKGFILDHYSMQGERNLEWLGQQVKKYHRKVETILMTLIRNGFLIEEVIEPSPSEDMIRNVKLMNREKHRPAFLIVKAKKINYEL